MCTLIVLFRLFHTLDVHLRGLNDLRLLRSLFRDQLVDGLVLTIIGRLIRLFLVDYVVTWLTVAIVLLIAVFVVLYSQQFLGWHDNLSLELRASVNLIF